MKSSKKGMHIQREGKPLVLVFLAIGALATFCVTASASVQWKTSSNSSSSNANPESASFVLAIPSPSTFVVERVAFRS
jgi:hypothetical protein